jgi:hypothetical protein
VAHPQPAPQLQTGWHAHRAPQGQGVVGTLAHPHEVGAQAQGF